MYSYSVHSQVYTLQTREFAVVTRGINERILLIVSRSVTRIQVLFPLLGG
jgi:hypothetical protein